MNWKIICFLIQSKSDLADWFDYRGWSCQLVHMVDIFCILNKKAYYSKVLIKFLMLLCNTQYARNDIFVILWLQENFRHQLKDCEGVYGKLNYHTSIRW